MNPLLYQIKVCMDALILYRMNWNPTYVVLHATINMTQWCNS